MDWRCQIAAFLKDRLSLEFKPDAGVRRISEGADFLGYFVRPAYMLARNRVVNNLKYRLALFRDNCTQRLRLRGKEVWKLSLEHEMVVQLRQILSSYLGHFKHANCHHLIASIFEGNGWLSEIFTITRSGRMVERLSYKGAFLSMRAQVGFFKYRLPYYVLFFMVGNFFELYGNDVLSMHPFLGLKVKTDFRGLPYGAGFPSQWIEKNIERTVAAGFNPALISEGDPGRYIKKRFVSALYRRDDFFRHATSAVEPLAKNHPLPYKAYKGEFANGSLLFLFVYAVVGYF